MARFPLLAGLTLLLAIGGVYGQVAGHDFVEWDDSIYVTSNSWVADGPGLQGLEWALTTFHDYLWHPLTWLSYQLDAGLYGTERAAPFLLTNVALHAVNTLLLFALLCRWTGRPAPSALVAGLFALHPLQVESVAWVSSRKELLGGLFLLGTLAGYTAWVRTRALRDYVLAFVLFAACLASKGTHVGLPFLLLLLDVWPFRRFRPKARAELHREREPIRELVNEKLPLLVVSFASLALGFRAAAGAENPWTTDPPLAARLAALPVNLAGYVGRVLWPVDLSIVYANPLQSGEPQASLGQVLAALALLATVTAICFAVAFRLGFRRDFRFDVRLDFSAWAAATGWLWFAFGLLPLLGLFPAGLRSPHDRYVYVPLIGFGVALVFGLGGALPMRRGLQRTGFAAGALLLVVCAFLSHAQVGYWRDSAALFEHALAVEEASPVVHFARGTALARAGDSEAGMRALRRAIELHPRYAEAHGSLGYLLGETGDLDAARRHLERALELRPGFTLAAVNLANLLIRSGARSDGMQRLEEAIRSDPRSARAWYWWGYHVEQAGRIDAARDAYRRVLEIEPTHRWARARLDELAGQN